MTTPSDQPEMPPGPTKGVGLLRTVLPIATVAVGVVTLAALVWMIRHIVGTSQGEDRFGELGKSFFWLAGMIAPGVGYALVSRKLGGQPTLAASILPIAFAHIVVTCAALGMWWGAYTIVAKSIILAWGVIGLSVFLPAIIAELSKPIAPDPPEKGNRRKGAWF
ncbi:MAG: hypothetical protein QM770_11775 [Tepidisphaeraceae bacterium]